MRKTSALFFSLLFLSVFPLKAQKVVWSLPVSESSRLSYLKVIGQNDNGVYLLRSSHPISNDNEFYTYRNNHLSVSCYDYDMRLLWEKAVDVLRKDTRIISFITVENNIQEISAEWNKQEKKFRLLSRSYDRFGKADTAYKIITEEDIETVDNETPYYIAASLNRKSFLIAYRIESPGNEQHYATLVCDTSLNIVRKNSLTVALPRKYFNSYRIIVSNSGDIFVFGVKIDSEKKTREHDRIFYTLFSNTAESKKWNEQEIRSQEHFLTDAGVAFDEMNQKVVVCGFYSDKTDYSTAGAFYYNVDPSSLVVSDIRLSSFSPSFLYKFIGEQKENYNRELANYSIDKIILRKDGGAVIVAESNYTSEYSYYDYYLRTYMSKKYFHHDNIIQLSVNKDGTMLWTDVVQKEQTSEDSDDAYVSYAAAVGNGKIHCIFNRLLKRKTQIMLNSTDALGNAKNSALFSEEQDVFIMPSASKQVEEDMLVIPAFKGKELHLAGIIF